jgi:hypothetical protein
MENKVKHLEMLQGVINRMANNSFLLKGWSVILVSALFALAAKDSNKLYIYLAYLPVVAFWILDGYFLWQERVYRKLYDKVRKLADSEIDFSMDVSSVTNQVRPWEDVVFSKTLSIFYGAIIGTILIVTLVTTFCF